MSSTTSNSVILTTIRFTFSVRSTTITWLSFTLSLNTKSICAGVLTNNTCNKSSNLNRACVTKGINIKECVEPEPNLVCSCR